MKNFIKKCSIFMILTILICSLAGCKTKSKTFEVKENGVLKIYTYTKDKSEKDLKKYIKSIVDKKTDDTNIKSIMVYFYDTDGEQYFNDIPAYAVGAWCSQEGVNASINNISTRNNNIFIEVNSKGDGEALDKEQKKEYSALLEKYKSDKQTSLSSCFLNEIIKNKKTEEMQDSKTETGKQCIIMSNVMQKYTNDGETKILTGEI